MPASALSSSRSVIRLSLAGLVLLCVSLTASSALLTHWLSRSDGRQAPTPSAAPASAAPEDPGLPWGDLKTLDIDIEQPEEYVSFEKTSERSTRWVFVGTASGRVRQMLGECGLDAAQVDGAMAPARVEDTATAVTVTPPDEVVLALAPAARVRLYTALGQWPANKYMAEPYRVSSIRLVASMTAAGVPGEIRALVQGLTYTRGGNEYFSDPDLVLGRIPTAEGRLALLKTLTTQTAVLARLRVGPESDVDKLVGYWGTVPGVRAKDLRPLFESLHKNADGGTISLLYLLPSFARERLYTFPLPQKDGDRKMDCHWTALNFFNETPDDQLSDNDYASAYIKEHFYSIGKPSRCGDLLFITNAKGEVVHSAVYIAADLCFTKNGVNFAQPWILMRMDALSAVYTFSEKPSMVFYRRKET